MRAIIITLIKIAAVVAVITVLLFMWVDSKMENEKLKLNNFLLTEQINEASAERDLMREAYIEALLRFVAEGKLSVDELVIALPQKEMAYLIARQKEKASTPDETGSNRPDLGR